MEGAAGGGRTPSDHCSKNYMPSLHIIYILFERAALWNPSHISQWDHQRGTWDKSREEEGPRSQWLLSLIRQVEFSHKIKNFRNKVFKRMWSCILHIYIQAVKKGLQMRGSSQESQTFKSSHTEIHGSYFKILLLGNNSENPDAWLSLWYAYIMCVGCM